MFRPDECVCVSHTKYGYHSIPLYNAMNGPITLVPPDTGREWEYPKSEELTLVALNPIKGFRQDIKCTSYRNFLVEMDDFTTSEQLAYIKKLNMPYSAAIFSGNKSLHFLISLDTDLPSEKVYRTFAEWILNVVTLADKNTKNPSRSIRIPGAIRDTGKMQELTEFKGSVKLNDLVTWLKKYPNSKPKEREERKISESEDFSRIKPKIAKMVYYGIRPPERNKQWFTVAAEFALTGYEEDRTIEILRPYFSSERDFKEKEWETTIRSAFKYIYERKGS